MANRLITEADVASAAALLDAHFSWPAGEGERLVRTWMADPNSTVAVNPDVQTICHSQYYFVPHVMPWGTGLSTQICELLPLTVGLFTDGTMPSLLAYTLREQINRVPASSSRPVWATLDETTVAKYQLAFRNNGLPTARRVKVAGRYIWMARCSDARDTVAALA